MELINIQAIIVVQVGHESLEISLVCYGGVISLSDCLEFALGNFLAVGFSEGASDG
jgi:hypothetical protein